MFAAVLATLGAVLVGCGTSGTPGATPSETAPTADASNLPEAEGTTQYPLTIETWAGQSVLEERPERIAVIGSTSVYDAVASLGAVPVYSYTHPGSEAAWWDPAERDKIEVIDYSAEELSPERVLEMDPDLIVALNYWFEGDTVAKELMKIAPLLDYRESPGNKEDWKEGQRLVGEALDLSAAAEQVIADTDAAVAKTAAENPEWKGKTATIANDYGGEWGIEYYSVPGGYAEQFLEGLGFAPNPLAEKFAGEPEVSEENLGLLDADVLLMSYSDEEVRKTRQSSELFQGLPPVKNGRLVEMSDPEDEVGGTWVFRQGANGPALTWLLDKFANEWMAQIDLDSSS